MARIDVGELTGLELTKWVGAALRKNLSSDKSILLARYGIDGRLEPMPEWGWAGAMLEHGEIAVAPTGLQEWYSRWSATVRMTAEDALGGEEERTLFGPTPQIAIFRAYVCQQFGPEVELEHDQPQPEAQEASLT